MKIKFYISPLFITKYYLYQNIRLIANKYKFEGRIIDVGCGEKPYKNLFKNSSKYECIDFRHYSKNKTFNSEKPDFYFKNNYLVDYKLPFKNESYENSFSFEVLEHHLLPNVFINEMIRVTKKGGFMLITVPFLGGLHEEPNDFQRYTKYGLIELITKGKKCKIMEVNSYGSLFSVISNLLNEYLSNFANKNKTFYMISIIIYLPFLIFQYITIFLDKILKSDQIVRGYVVLARKN